MRLYFLTNIFIMLLGAQLAYSMDNRLEQKHNTLDTVLENQKNLQQILDRDKHIIEDYQKKTIILDAQIESYKKREEAALKAEHDIMIFNWLMASGIGIIIVGCIIYSFWESRAPKNINRYKKIRY